MGSRHPNPRLAKIHRSYSVEEIARLFRVHKNTVRAWLRQGLPCSKKTMAKLACLGGGPVYTLYNRTSLYAPADFDAFAEAKLRKHVRSTSEYGDGK